MKIFALILFLLNFCLQAEESGLKTQAATNPQSSLPSKASKPTLYYFSSPSCPACAMMAPQLKRIKEEQGDSFELKEFRFRSEERTKTMVRFIKKVDLNYVPTWVLSDESDRVYTSGRGYVPWEDFSSDILEGLEKRRKLDSMRLSSVLFVCQHSEPFCAKSEQAVEEWATERGDLRVEKMDLDTMETPEGRKRIQEKLDSLKYLSGFEYIPAVIALTPQGEVIDLLQRGFSKEELHQRLADF